MNSRPLESKGFSGRWWLRGLGVVWLAGFLWWFYSFTLPNGEFPDGTPVSRSDVWILLPDILWANLSPNPNPGASPSGGKYLPQRFDLMVVAAWILAGAWGLGHLAQRLLGIRGDFDALTQTVFAFALGLSGLSLITLGCGLAGLLHRAVLGGIVVGLILAEVICRIRDRQRGSGGSTSKAEPELPDADDGKGRQTWSQRRWDVLPGICLLVVTPFVLAMLLGAMLPSIDFDVKEYHLEGPKEYFRQGRVTFLPHNVYTSFPFLTEMLSLLAMVLRDDWFRGALAGKVVLMTMAPLTALGLFAAGRRWFGSTVGWLCVVLYLTTPWVYRISIIAYAEGGLTFYLFATLLSVIWLTDSDPVPGTQYPVSGTQHQVPGTQNEVRGTEYSVPGTQYAVPGNGPQISARSAHDDPAGAGQQRRNVGHLVLCGLLAGSAVACKYPGVLSVAIPLGGFLLVAAWRRSRKTSGKATSPEPGDGAAFSGHLWRVAVTAGLFTLGTLVTFGPWMGKNIAETGNPVYPLLYPVFGGRDWDEAAHRKWQNGHPPMILRLIETPQNIPVSFAERAIDVLAKSDWQSPLLFGAAPLAIFWTTRRRLVGWLWGYVGWLFLTWWALTHHIDRFWVPMLPVVALLGGAGLGSVLGAANDFRGSQSAGTRRLSAVIPMLVSLMIAGAVLFNLGYITTGLCGYNAYLTDLEAAKRDATTSSIAVLREHLPDDARVLVVGGAEMFDAEFDYAYNTVFDECLFERWTSAAEPGLLPSEQSLRPADDIRRTFRQQGITHVFVDWKEVLRHRVPGGYGFSDFVSPERFRQLVAEQVLSPVALDPSDVLWPWESLDENTREEVERWAPSLYRNVRGTEWLLQYELFEVR